MSVRKSSLFTTIEDDEGTVGLIREILKCPCDKQKVDSDFIELVGGFIELAMDLYSYQKYIFIELLVI